MIIRRLHIDNFGCFHDFNLKLEPGLNRISGPNEFGKTTLLEFLRRLFWGFPDRRRKLNPYPALKGSGHYGGFLEVTLRSGEELRLERRGEKGRLKLIYPDGRCEEIGADDLVIRREEKPGLVASSENGVTIALATELTPELVAEGFARELVSKIQNLRKELGFEVTDRIIVTYDASGEAAAAFGKFHDYIAGEVLACRFAPGSGDTDLDVNGAAVKVTVTRA